MRTVFPLDGTVGYPYTSAFCTVGTKSGRQYIRLGQHQLMNALQIHQILFHCGLCRVSFGFLPLLSHR